MTDMLHSVLSQFRDTMLTAVARLEFSLRDLPMSQATYTGNPNATWCSPNHVNSRAMSECDSDSNEHIHEIMKTLDGLSRRISKLEVREPKSNDSVIEVDDVSGILDMKPPEGSRNIIIRSAQQTPALSAAVAAANPPDFTISTGDSATAASRDEEVEEGEESEAEEEEGEAEVEEEEEEEDDEEPDLRPLQYKGEQYFVDADNSLYKETDEGYEEVGKWDAKMKIATFYEEEAASEEEEEDAIEVEDFVYKGTTYQRDAENNVYLDGEQVGTWNGKKILPVA